MSDLRIATCESRYSGCLHLFNGSGNILDVSNGHRHSAQCFFARVAILGVAQLNHQKCEERIAYCANLLDIFDMGEVTLARRRRMYAETD